MKERRKERKRERKERREREKLKGLFILEDFKES